MKLKINLKSLQEVMIELTGNCKEESEQLLHEFKYFDENCDNKLTTLPEKHVLQEHQYVLS